MAWKSGAFPTTFAVIGDSLPPDRRATAFSVQSVLVRVPRVIGAPAGGLLIAGFGLVAGIRLSLMVTLALALVVLAVQYYGYRENRAAAERGGSGGARTIFSNMPAPLTRLLTADCLVRIGEGIAASFIILFVTQVRHFSAAEYGLFYAVQQSVAIAFYVPGGKLADMTGRSPIVALTFVFFAAFPLAVRFASTTPALLGAFVIGGLKEIGEPARKSLIVDLAPDAQRARTVGVYYTIRNFLVAPAGLVGGLLWQRAPQLPLDVAFAVSLIGLVVFVLSSRRD
jgi:MFS family permease